MSLWKAIAKNEIKIGTSRVRNHRVLFFVLLYSLLFLWAFIISPYLFDLFMPTLVAQIPQIEIFVGLIIESLLMMFFLMFMIYPLNNVFRKTDIGFKETLLASPATAGDIFLGEFLGKLLIYFAGVLIFAPLLIGMINYLINFTILHYFIIYACVIGHITLATLLGNIIASMLEHKIARNPKFRDLGKVIMFIISIAMVAIMYSMQFAFEFLSSNPELKNWLMFYPSLWFTNIILYSINPTLISTYILNIWSNVVLVIFVPLLVVYMAYTKAEKFFTLEGGIEKTTSIIKKEHVFYKLVRRFIPKSFKTLVIIQLKEFLRKKENIMKLVYNSLIITVMGTIISLTNRGGLDFIDKNIMSLLIIITSGLMYSIMIGNYVLVGSKDLVWVYKRSPRDVKTLIYSYIQAMLIPNILIGIGLTIYFSILMQLSLFMSFFFFFAYVINNMLMLCQVTGIQCLNPSFEEKGKQMTVNVFIQTIIYMSLLFFSIFMAESFISLAPSEEFVPFFIYLPIFSITSSFSIPFLYFGILRLSKIE